MLTINECRICKNREDNKSYLIKEMYIGTREVFEYFECSKCGCLQIKTYPSDLERFYPDNYGSFNVRNTDKPNRFISYLRNQKLKYVLNEKRTLAGFILNLLFKSGFEQKMLPAGVKSESSILDVGSGAGSLILNLRNKGFKNITGSDIFIKEDIIFDEHLRILKKDLKDFDGQYDFIMLNHSFEHMPNQNEVLQDLYRLIKPDKMVMIRIPVKTEYIWKRYGINWGSIHAPNHFYLHTIQSMKILAQNNCFTVDKIVFDSGIYQFYSSEQFIKNIPLLSKESYHVNRSKSIFSMSEIRKFKRLTRVLNKTSQGDCACFYLKPQNK
jgi:2-polyprenyl-3-methyl-5-hydroxy-6-metoxy-1,4-benzoquinol methylase